MTTEVLIPFAGGEFRFHLTERQMFLLEVGKTEEGLPQRPMLLGAAYARLLRGRYELEGRNVGLPTEAAFSVVEMNAIIRAALVGGGGGTINGQQISWDEYSVDSYLRRHVDPMPLLERWDLCLVIMGARVEGLSVPADGARIDPAS
jgi:hypothetical protein